MTGFFQRFLRWCPGALGLVLRARLYPGRFKSCGKGVLFGRFVDISGAHNIHLGDRVVLSNGVVMDAPEASTGTNGIYVGDDVFIGTDTSLKVVGDGKISIGNGSNFSSFCHVETKGAFVMGEDCLVAGYCRFGSINEKCQGDGGITIGSGCWLGVRLEIRPGAVIGDGAIVGAHGTVAGDIQPFGIAVGVPAKTIRVRGQD